MSKVLDRCPPHQWVTTPSGRVVCLWCEQVAPSGPSGPSEGLLRPSLGASASEGGPPQPESLGPALGSPRSGASAGVRPD